MRSGPQGLWGQQPLDWPMGISPHQYVRAAAVWVPRHCLDGQHGCSSLYQPAWGRAGLSSPLQIGHQAVAVGSLPIPLPQGSVCARSPEHGGGHHVEGGPKPRKMETPPAGVRTLGPFLEGRSQLLCLQGINTLPSILLPTSTASLLSPSSTWSSAESRLRMCGWSWWPLSGPTCPGSQQSHTSWMAHTGSSETCSDQTISSFKFICKLLGVAEAECVHAPA